jgi:hypothetical protein
VFGDAVFVMIAGVFVMIAGASADEGNVGTGAAVAAVEPDVGTPALFM